MGFSRQRILVVEDSPDDVLLLEHMFRKTNLGQPLQVVRTGEEAIAWLEGRGEFNNRGLFPLPTLLFLDLKLPGMPGLEVLAWIRQQPRFDRLQVVVLTASHHTIDVYRAYELGANSFLVKPVQIETLNTLPRALRLSWHSVATSKSTSITEAPP